MRERAPSIPTVPDSLLRDGAGTGGRAVWLRRAGMAVLALVLLAGLLGAYGQRQVTVADEAAGLGLEVQATTVSRSGMPQRWQADIRSPDGPLPPTLDVRFPSGWLAMLDQHAVTPATAEEWQEEGQVVWTFEPPPGAQHLAIRFDARIQVDARGRFDGGASIEVDGTPGPAVTWTTWIWP